METPAKIFLVLVAAVAAGGLLYVFTRQEEEKTPAPQPAPPQPVSAPVATQEANIEPVAVVKATAPQQNSWTTLGNDISQGMLCPNDGKIPCLGAEYMQ